MNTAALAPHGAHAPGEMRLRTGDIDRVVAVTTQLFAHHKVRSVGAGPLDISVFGRPAGELLLGGVSYNTSVAWEVDETREALIVTEPMCDGHLGGQSFRAGDLIVFRPDWCGHVGVSPPGDLRNTCIAQSSLLNSARGLLGIPLESAPVFSSCLAGDSRPARRIRAILELLHSEAGASEQAGRAVQRARTHWFLMELLTLWPHSHSRYLDGAAAMPRSIARACEFIDAHLAEPISVVDIAAAACVGVRALTLGFVKHFGQTPWRYTRERRLDAARHDLCASDAATTVTAVALKWQFSNPGLFARYYKERFGELPRATLG